MWYHTCGVMDFNLSPKGTPQLFTLLFSLATEGKTPQSSAFRETADDSLRLAVPEKPFGLTLILRFFDRCGNSGFPSSATGGGNPQFPLGRGGYKEV